MGGDGGAGWDGGDGPLDAIGADADGATGCGKGCCRPGPRPIASMITPTNAENPKAPARMPIQTATGTSGGLASVAFVSPATAREMGTGLGMTWFSRFYTWGRGAGPHFLVQRLRHAERAFHGRRRRRHRELYAAFLHWTSLPPNISGTVYRCLHPLHCTVIGVKGFPQGLCLSPRGPYSASGSVARPTFSIRRLGAAANSAAPIPNGGTLQMCYEGFGNGGQSPATAPTWP